jgi:hypothetical protein
MIFFLERQRSPAAAHPKVTTCLHPAAGASLGSSGLLSVSIVHCEIAGLIEKFVQRIVVKIGAFRTQQSNGVHRFPVLFSVFDCNIVCDALRLLKIGNPRVD